MTQHPRRCLDWAGTDGGWPIWRSGFKSIPRPLPAKLFDCPLVCVYPISPPYVVAQTVSVSSHRTEVAAAVGHAADLQGVESRRAASARASFRAAPWTRRQVSRCRRAPAEVLHPRHVPLPERRGTARRASGGLHGHRHPCPLQARARLQRAASDGLGCVRPARRAIRDQDRPASAQDDRGKHRELHEADQKPRLQLRLVARGEHDGPRLLQVDAMDFPPALQCLLRRGEELRAPDLRADRKT